MNTPENIDLQSSPVSGQEGQAIILAGGLGTRLRSVISAIPKCMAPVAGKPFLFYVIEYLKKQGIDKFIFSLGYKSEIIIDYINDQYPRPNVSSGRAMLNIQFSVEEEPLGTGGAIKLACGMATEKNILILNGDTLFKADVKKLFAAHHKNEADCTLALKPMHNFDRYGLVEINEDNFIASFKEKQQYESGFINGGIYILNTTKFLQEELPAKFSFEKDYLEQYVDKRKMYGLVQDEYFIDIGIPEDYERAQNELGIGD